MSIVAEKYLEIPGIFFWMKSSHAIKMNGYEHRKSGSRWFIFLSMSCDVFVFNMTC